jgi:hypothetical protein
MLESRKELLLADGDHFAIHDKYFWLVLANGAMEALLNLKILEKGWPSKPESVHWAKIRIWLLCPARRHRKGFNMEEGRCEAIFKILISL